MNKQLTIAVLLVLLLGIGTWLYLSTEVEISLDGEITPGDGVTQRIEPTRQAPQPRSSRAEAVKVTPPSKAPSPTEQEPDSTVLLDASNSILIHVVDGKTKEGVAGCKVSMILSDRRKQAGWLVKMKSDMIGFFREHGKHYQTSATGEVRLPTEHPILAISSYTDSLFGTVRIPSTPPDQLTIELQPIIFTRVRVVDENKKPVALSEVALGVEHKSGRKMEMLVKKTDEDGLAALSFPQDLLLKLAKEGKLFVGLRGLFSPPIETAIDVAELPQEVIELVLPRTSALSLKVLNAAGKICQESMFITVTFVKAFKKNGDDRSLPAYQAIAAKGEAVISQVACGANLRLRVEPRGGASFASMEKTIASSDVPGQTREIVFQIEAKFPEMTGRLVDEDGEPMAKQAVYFRWGNQVPGKRFKVRGWTIRTDEKGKFAVLLKEQFLEAASRRFLEFTIKDKFDSTLMIATTTLPLGGGDVVSQDVGDVLMVELPVLLSGRVVDGHGESVEGALVSLFARREVSERQRQRMPKRIYNGSRIGTSKTNRNGAFEIRGQSDLSEFVLNARKSGFSSARQMAAAGTEDVLISITKPGFVRGRVFLPADMTDEVVSITVESSSTRGYWRGHPEDDGTFKTDKLEAGDYEFYCFCPIAGARKLHSIQSFSVESGRTTDLGDIWLLENSKRVEIHLVEPSKLEARTVLMASILDADSQVELGMISMGKTVESFLLPETPFDLRVYVRGFRDAIYRHVQPGRLDVKLTKGFPLRLVVENLESLPPKAVVRLTLRSVIRPHMPNRLSFSEGKDSNTVRVPRVGTYEIFAKLRRAGFRTIRLGMSMSTIEVKGSDAIQEFRLRVNPDSLKKTQEK